MRAQVKIKLWTLVAMVVLGGMGWLSAGEVLADWTYDYYDDFDTNKAKKDSYEHSIFWPMNAFPPPEPYLYYSRTQGNPPRALMFMGYQGLPAHLNYCFPLRNHCLPIGTAPAIRAVSGTLEFDLQFPLNTPGCFAYSLSPNGRIWTIPIPLTAGHHNIAISSAQGTCYVAFLGRNALIDNLEVYLNSPPAVIFVPSQYETIQEAIDAASDGDIIEVAPGTYRGDGNRDIEFLGKAITVRSAAGPGQTTIDCRPHPDGGQEEILYSHRGFYFHQAERSDSIVRGFTIRRGRIPGSELPPDHMRWNLDPAHPVGGGIYCEFSSPTIINCIIKNCATELGGGIGCVGASPALINCTIATCSAGGLGACESGGLGGGIGMIRASRPKIVGCVIKNNSGYYNSYGGGIFCLDSVPRIHNCAISDNKATGNIVGGGIYCARKSFLTLNNCIISHNTADMGGGILAELGNILPGAFGDIIPVEVGDVTPGPGIRVTNCTIAHNRLSGPQMPPFPGGGIQTSRGTDIIVKNSIIWHNEGTQLFLIQPPCKSPVVYSDIQNGYLGQGNIDEDPLFAVSSMSAMRDYHLCSLYGRYNPLTGDWVFDNEHSPCIDAGDPSDSIGQEPAPNGKRINMGAYGGTWQASKSRGIGVVYHVDGINGDDTNDGLSRETAFATIQKGIDSAKNSDAVLVWPAVYEEGINFQGKAITVTSGADAAVLVGPNREIDGVAVAFHSGEGPASALTNFVIRDSIIGVFCLSGSPTISNVTVVDNENGIVAYGDSDPDISNSIFWRNTDADLFGCRARYSCIERLNNEGEGNISENPLFAGPAHDDYHLLSERGRFIPFNTDDVSVSVLDGYWVLDERTSPCVDAADPVVNPMGERMPNGARLNMGAYGGMAYASMSEWPVKGDINRDGMVDLFDFAILARDWLWKAAWIE